MGSQRLALAITIVLLGGRSDSPTSAQAKAPNQSPPAAYLTVAYESTDVSHVACLLEYPGEKPRWVGFGPHLKYKLIAGGAIDAYSLQRDIERYARFRVDSERLRRAERATRAKYKDRWYLLGITDCVTFATDLAEAAGLQVPSKVHFQVEHLIDKLVERNPRRVAQVDRLPYPWTRCPILEHQRREKKPLVDRVAIRLDYVRCRETESVGIRDNVVFVAVTQFGQRRRIPLGNLADDEHWSKGAVLFEVPRGTAIGFQVWDVDTINNDDLVFQSSFCACQNGHTCEHQSRGRAFRASRSKYEVGYTILGVK